MVAFSSAFAALALSASSALANLVVTQPVSNSILYGNVAATISWVDDGTTPSLTQWGNATVALCTGNQTDHIQVEFIANVTVYDETLSVQFTPSASIGPDGDYYLICFQSYDYVNTTNGLPAVAYSDIFTMANMTGVFNSTEWGINNGTTTSSSSSSGSSSPSSTSLSTPPGSSPSPSDNNLPPPAVTGSPNGATSLVTSGAAALAGVAALIALAL